jgi:hypothetical protein
MTSFSEAAAMAVLAFLIQSAVVMAVSIAMSVVAGNRRPALRVAILRAGIGAVLSVAVLGPVVPTVMQPWWTLGTSSATSSI